MWGRRFCRGPRSARHANPTVEALDVRVLLSSSVGPSLGPGLSPGQALPSVSSPATIVNPHTTINQFLSTELGPGVEKVEQQVEAKGTSGHARVADQVLANPFLHAVLSRQDTYTLLTSVAGTTLAGGTTATAGQPETVAYAVPSQARISSLGPDQTQVEVLPTPSSQGFFANIPTANIRTNQDGTATAQVPRSVIPSDVVVPVAPSLPTGPLSDVFTSTGPVILSAYSSSVPRPGPNAPRSIPGLRLSSAFASNPNFPTSQANALLYAFRVAVDRNVFALNAAQTDALNAGVSDFETRVAALNQAGSFRTSVPPAAPRLPKKQLRGTLEVSLGAVRDLSSVDASQSGLQLTHIGNFPGRFNVGYVFDRAGNFGVALTARSPLAGAPRNVASPNVVAGDIHVEVSNARSLGDLNGLRSFEALNQGVGLSGGLSASNYANGVATFGASAGYGSGLEVGTGTAYTKVIPLGNVYALIPSAPKK